MNLNFRQGIVKARNVSGSPNFLVNTVSGINIDITSTDLIVTVIHGSSNYLIREPFSVNNAWSSLAWNGAWGPAQPNPTFHLYWNVNIAIGSVTRSYTHSAPLVTSTEPVSPLVDQHWFDTNTNDMKVWNGSFWIPVIRVFAGSFTPSSNTIDHQPFGSQVGITSVIHEYNAGYIAVSDDFKWIKLSSGEFLTSDTDIIVNEGTISSPFRIGEFSNYAPLLAGEVIPALSAVTIISDNTIGLAYGSDPDKHAIGIVENDAIIGEPVKVLYGNYFTSDTWNWDINLGKYLYCGEAGELIQVKPINDAQEVATIISANTIHIGLDRHGASGFSGFSGITGSSGFSGFSGRSGFSGLSGFSGFSGKSGFSGFSGLNGISGFSGLSGFSGKSGFSGFSGFSGRSGFSGLSGFSSTSGFSGYSGKSGFSAYTWAVNVSQFSPAADGVTDDLIPLTLFFQSANNNPGVLHVLNKATYAISDGLPETNVSYTNIIGAGVSRHDLPPNPNGTVIKAIGSVGSWAGKVMRTIRPIAGAGNQHLACNTELGIAYDCNDIAPVGFLAESCFNYNFDIGAFEGRNIAAVFRAITGTLGEAADMQESFNLNLKLMQTRTEARNHYGVMFTGNNIANFSLNKMNISGMHTNVPLGLSAGSDNNKYTIRAFGIGTATESWSFIGAATLAESTRQETIQYYTSNLPYHVYGTGAYTVGASDIYCESLDKGNGTPDPIIEVGGSGGWKNNSASLFGDTPFQVMSVTPIAQTGTLGAVTCSIRYEKRGRRCFGNITLFGNNGTGAGTFIRIPLPFTEFGGVYWISYGDDVVTQAKPIKGIIEPAGNTLILRTHAGGYPFVTGDVLSITFNYEV